jgi:hypothetical protein
MPMMTLPGSKKITVADSSINLGWQPACSPRRAEVIGKYHLREQRLAQLGIGVGIRILRPMPMILTPRVGRPAISRLMRQSSQ